MNQLITSNALTMSSQEISDLLNIRHDNVKRTIAGLSSDKLNDDGSLKKAAVITAPQIEDESYRDGSGRLVVTSVYRICKRDSFVVVAQLSPQFTAALVDRWAELESNQPSGLPKTFADALRLAADQQEQIERQQAQLAIAAPKAEFVDRYVDATGLKGFRQVAKLLNAKEPSLRCFLSDMRIMYKLGNEWVPYQNHIDAGRFEVRAGASDGGHAFNQAKFTPKGVAWIAGLWAKHAIN